MNSERKKQFNNLLIGFYINFTEEYGLTWTEAQPINDFLEDFTRWFKTASEKEIDELNNELLKYLDGNNYNPPKEKRKRIGKYGLAKV